MLIRIGSSPEEEDSDVVGLLLQCHERIRQFVALAGRLAAEREAAADDIRQAAKRITRYFSEALPLHVADEEESIVPRLSGHSSELDASLQRMQREHLEHHSALQSLLEVCGTLQTSPDKLDELRPRLAEAAATLEREFSTHLRQEEEIVLPAIRNVLTHADRHAILLELRGRRG